MSFSYRTDHEQWDEENTLETAEHSGFDSAITYVEVGDWAYITMGPDHEANRSLLRLFEWVSADCTQAATELDPDTDEE